LSASVVGISLNSTLGDSLASSYGVSTKVIYGLTLNGVIILLVGRSALASYGVSSASGSYGV
tara:strand:- start:707 stop:892 length:186 start_codon:yes stop_codon:yes gene_type:complete